MRFTLDSSHDTQVPAVDPNEEEEKDTVDDNRQPKPNQRQNGGARVGSTTPGNGASSRNMQRPKSSLEETEGEAAEAEAEAVEAVHTKKSHMSSLTVASIILMLGLAAAGAFWSVGVITSLTDSESAFERDVEDVAHRLLSAIREYETAALWVQQSCREHKLQFQQQQQQQHLQNTSMQITTESTNPRYPSDFRAFFRDVYEGVIAQGLAAYAIQYSPNVTHGERPWYEQEAITFYQRHYPSVAAQYQGFSTAQPTANGTITRVPVSQQPFYFPVHLVEPVMDDYQAMDVDLYAAESTRRIIDSALQTKRSHITQRLRLLQESDSDPDPYSVMLIHPGLTTSRPYDLDSVHGRDTTDVASIVIRIHDLLQYSELQDHLHKAIESNAPGMKVYLYDSTPDDTTQQPTMQFLGAADLRRFQTEDGQVQRETVYLPEVTLEQLKINTTSTTRLHMELLNVGQRQWSLACVVTQGTYQTSATLSILAGAMVLIAFICLAMWIHATMNRAALASKLESKSQEEQALLRINHAKQAAAAERQLNEFIAHEVRNPLAAAMSACSFVTSVLQQESQRTASIPLPASTTSNNPTESHHSKQPSPLFSIAPSPLFSLATSQASEQECQRPKPSPLFAIATTNSDTNGSTCSTPPVANPSPLFQLPDSTNSHRSDSTESASQAPSDSPASKEVPDGNKLPAPLFSLRATTLPTQRETVDNEPNKENGSTPTAPLFSLIMPSTTERTSQSHIRRTPPSGSSSLVPAPPPIVADEDTRESILADLYIIDSSLQFINDLLRNMLDVQRAACHQLTIEKGPTHIYRDILEPVDSMLYMRGTNVEVQLDCGPHTNLLVETDRLRLKQVVLNLGRNAAKFVQKGHVRFRVMVVSGKTDHDKLLAKDGTNSTSSTEEAQPSPETETVQIWIEDTGPGIPENKKSKLFAKFQDSLDSLSQGTGLGLSLCRILVRLMGGEIWLDETYHSGFDDRPGSRFIIDLCTPPLHVEACEDIESNHNLNSSWAGVGPYVEAPTDAKVHPGQNNEQMDGSVRSDSLRRSGRQPPQPQVLPVTISCLLVDDDTVLRKLLVRTLKAIAPGWSIQEAASGEAALSLIDEGQTFDLIFMDQYMASMQKQLLGTETTHALRSRGVQAKICGLSANEMAEEFFAAGANAFVCKPLPTKKDSLNQILCDILLDDDIKGKSSRILKRKSSAVAFS